MLTLAFQPDAERYYAEGYWRSGDLWGEFVSRASAARPKTALHVGEQSITYEELERGAVALSARLGASSIGPGDVVVLLGRHSIEVAVAMLACFHRAAVAAPLPPMFGVAQLSALAAQADAKALISFGGDAEIAKCESLRGLIPLVLALRPDDVCELIGERPDVTREPIGADEPALLLHSSGTTSAPKGIMHSTNTLRYATEQILERWELPPQETHLVVCEFGFVGSLVFGYLGDAAVRRRRACCCPMGRPKRRSG